MIGIMQTKSLFDPTLPAIKGPEGVKGPQGPDLPPIQLIPVYIGRETKSSYSLYLIAILTFIIGFLIGAVIS
jgi:hypothetical protein